MHTRPPGRIPALDMTMNFIITRCRDKMNICSTRTMCGANCGTDHQMLRSRLIFSIRGKTQSVRSYENRKAEHQPGGESGTGNGQYALTQSSEDNEPPCWTSNRLCTIPLKHLSANMRRNIKTGSTQTTRFYWI